MISANMSRVNSQQNSECRSVRRRGIMDVAETNLIGGETELKALGSVAHSDLKKQIKEELTSSNRVIEEADRFLEQFHKNVDLPPYDAS